VSTMSEGVVEAGLKLPEPERAQVVQVLLDSLSPDAEALLDDVWAKELDRQLAEFLTGNADVVQWSELKEQK
jgi:putative addiction module component (TIGR02574 family)